MFAFPNVQVNEGAGRTKTDPINEKRIQLVLDRHEEWYLKNHGKSLPYFVTKEQAQRGLILYPTLGAVVLFS